MHISVWGTCAALVAAIKPLRRAQRRVHSDLESALAPGLILKDKELQSTHTKLKAWTVASTPGPHIRLKPRGTLHP